MVITVNQAKTTVRAVALVGFYRGEALVHPGDILELGRQEFGELKSFYKVDYAPPEAPPQPAKPSK